MGVGLNSHVTVVMKQQWLCFFSMSVCVGCTEGTKRPRGRPRKEGPVIAVRSRGTGAGLFCYANSGKSVAICLNLCVRCFRCAMEEARTGVRPAACHPIQQ